MMQKYDANANLTSQAIGNNCSLAAQQQPTGEVISFTRNTNLQQTSLQNPLDAIWSTLYDGSGNLVGQQSPLRSRITFTQDSFNNLVSAKMPDGTINTLVYGYGGNSFATTGAKRRLQASADALGNRTSFGFTS